MRMVLQVYTPGALQPLVLQSRSDYKDSETNMRRNYMVGHFLVMMGRLSGNRKGEGGRIEHVWNIFRRVITLVIL
jgi:hypothetical protein